MSPEVNNSFSAAFTGKEVKVKQAEANPHRNKDNFDLIRVK